jgi:ATP-dependent Lon protease
LTDYLAEIFAELRRLNYQTHVNYWAEFGRMTGRNQDAVKKTAVGLLKLLYPHRRSPDSLDPRELARVLELGVEMRKRVTDQLAVILPAEYSHVIYAFELRNAVAGPANELGPEGKAS